MFLSSVRSFEVINYKFCIGFPFIGLKSTQNHITSHSGLIIQKSHFDFPGRSVELKISETQDFQIYSYYLSKVRTQRNPVQGHIYINPLKI